MRVENGGEVAASKLLQPRVEAEVAFFLKEDLQGPGVGIDQALAATESVAPALENHASATIIGELIWYVVVRRVKA